jgi:uncharacterized MAPEG superfamily protein
MTTAFWCVLAVAGLTYLCTGVAKVGGRMPPRANHSPRDWLDKLQGWPKRAHFAQQNGFEVFPIFAAAVIIAQLSHAPQGRVDTLALSFVGLRVVYVILYLADQAYPRTAAWFGGMVCIVWLFALGS